MNWFRKMMMGRYGMDQLSIALLVLYTVLYLSGQLTRLYVLMLLAFIPLALCFFRIFSRNVNKRYNENYRFTNWWNPVQVKLRRAAQKVQAWFRKTAGKAKDRKTHRYYKCPNCTNTLRVPRGRGKICITCPVCKTEFVKKT
jgi:hypothetical protein